MSDWEDKRTNRKRCLFQILKYKFDISKLHFYCGRENPEFKVAK